MDMVINQHYIGNKQKKLIAGNFMKMAIDINVKKRVIIKIPYVFIKTNKKYNANFYSLLCF